MNDTGKNGLYFHCGWRFALGDAFPIGDAAERLRDGAGRLFYEPQYRDDGWERVTLPHTFNDGDLFCGRIRDAGGRQRRTAAFYRNWLTIPPEHKGKRVFIEFEGIRQTCYLYVNGVLSGCYEAGAAPFGFDITPRIDYSRPNLIAVATDNTSTRDIPFCAAETPNMPGAVPGTYLQPQDRDVDKAREGVGYFWNCNDFNPSVGGITRPVRIHFKSGIYMTLPLYSNLRTRGAYIYGTDFDTDNKTARIAAEVEVRNESGKTAAVCFEAVARSIDGRETARFCSREMTLEPTEPLEPELLITPKDAYRNERLPDGTERPVPIEDENAVEKTATESKNTTVIKAVSGEVGLRFWSDSDPYLYRVELTLLADGRAVDSEVIETGFRSVEYDRDKGLLINGVPVWLRGYAQRASNEWAAIGIAPEWLKDEDAMLIKASGANHIRWMHVAGSPADIRAFDRHGIICTQPAGDKERDTSGRQWDQRVELMRDVLIAFRNHPSILFWEAGNNSISAEHMREMRLLKEELDPQGGRFMGCRTLNTEETVREAEYVGTMLNRHAARFISERMPITETEYLREEAPRRVWDDFSPPDFDLRSRWVGRGGMKRDGFDFYDLTAEEFALAAAKGYAEFFNDRIGGASGKNLYSGCAALCWTDSAQHGRQAFSENARMSGRADAARVKKQSFDVFRVLHSTEPAVKLLGHWSYPKEDGKNYLYREKRFNGTFWEDTGGTAYRDPRHKTVYVIGSYGVKRVELEINGRPAGSCETPEDTFVFEFKDIDVTESGYIRAAGFDYNENAVCFDRLRTAGEPAKIVMTPRAAPGGLRADGADIAYVDIEITDKYGNICPLCFDRIDFSLEGEGVFLGGYNSGKFEGFGNESVIHKSFVYAECGTNRVFLRSTRTAGDIALSARMGGLAARIRMTSRAVPLDALCGGADRIYEDYTETAAPPAALKPIPEADRIKYKPDAKPCCKILVNGQEPDTRGIGSLNKNGRIWGAVLCILERLKTVCGGFDYKYSEADGRLELSCGENTIEAEAGRTHLLVNGREELMDGEPFIAENGQLVMEVSAIVPYIDGVSVRYDDKIGVFRISSI